MINVSAEGLDAMLKTIAEMPDQIAALGTQKMAAELTEWQTQDMRRHYPNTTQEDDKNVSTEIWPRSRVTQKKKPPTTFTKPPRQVYAKPRGGPPLHSARPILRDDLFKMLCQRMSALMSQELRWKV
jgi:hypothetical protein